MIIYTDVISGDELASDAYDPVLVDDIAYEIEGKLITIKEGQVDIGANASAEEAAEELEEGATQIINVVHSFRLQSTQFDKKSYLTHLKSYMKSLKTKLAETNPDRVEAFEKGAQAFAKKLVGKFKDLDFYIGESMDPDAMVLVMDYRPDGVTPYFMIWKDGVKETKV